jgi:hypothetical protein
MVGNWRNTRTIPRQGECRRFSAGRYGSRRLGTSAGIMRSSISAIPPASWFCACCDGGFAREAHSQAECDEILEGLSAEAGPFFVRDRASLRHVRAIRRSLFMARARRALSAHAAWTILQAGCSPRVDEHTANAHSQSRAISLGANWWSTTLQPCRDPMQRRLSQRPGTSMTPVRRGDPARGQKIALTRTSPCEDWSLTTPACQGSRFEPEFGSDPSGEYRINAYNC